MVSRELHIMKHCKINRIKRLGVLTSAIVACTSLLTPTTAQAAGTTDTVKQKRDFLSRLQLGGYGEVTYSYNFFSDNVNRYSHAADYKDSKGYGSFDIPHFVIMLGFDFGKGWSMGSEIEFEHGGVESAVELEQEEVGEFEKEIERGGEVALEQFWIQKTFIPQFSIRAGHMVVPVGATNAHHLPTEYFTVFRPEGENQIMPCTWHQTGISFRGKAGKWRYEAMVTAGLNSMFFSKDEWIKNGAASPFEFTPANKLGVAARVDNYSVNGLRLSLSGYYGHSFRNTLQSDNGKYKDVKGAVSVLSFDFEYKNYGWIVRGNADWGHLGDAEKISEYNRGQSSTSPYKRTHIGKDAVAAGAEAGYNLMGLWNKKTSQKLYLFGRYEYYDAYIPTKNSPDYSWTDRHRIAAGINYYPLKQLVIKAEFSERFLHKQYNNEPSISLGVCYAGWFL